MADVTAKSILEQDIPTLFREKPELAKDISAVIHFVVTGEGGGEWTVDCSQAEGSVKGGLQGASKMTVTVAAEDLVKMRLKQLNPQMAAMQSKLKFKPFDMALALKLGKLL